MRRTINIWANMDWITVFLYLTLVLMGWFNIYAAVYSEEHSSILDMDMRYGKQMIWIVAAFIIALTIIFIDLRFYSLFAYVIFALSLLALLAVAFVGKEVNGARSWFELGSFKFQPTEFAKSATCLALAKYLSSYNVKIEKLSTLFVVGIIIFAPAALIMLQPDFGSVIVYVSLVFVLYREGFPGGFLFFGFLLVLIFVLTLVASQLAVLIIIISIALLTLIFLNRSYIEAIVAGIAIITLFFLVKGICYLFNIHYVPEITLIISACIACLGGLTYYIFKRNANIFWVSIAIVGAIAFTFSVDYLFDNVLEQHQKQRVNIFTR